MPTATKPSSAATKARAKRRKPARRKTTSARTASSTRTFNGTAPAGARVAFSDRPVAAIGDYAERVVLIPVGATLIARDRVVSSVTDALSTYSSPSKTQAQLRRFERRGATARRRLEREVRKTRTRVERDLRQRRRRVEKTVTGIEARRDSLAKNGSDLANRVQERVLNLV